MNTGLVSGLRRFVVAFFIFSIVAGALTGSVFAATAENETLSLRVVRVVDGDTIWTEGGEQVRYIGIDTPETGESFYKEAPVGRWPYLTPWITSVAVHFGSGGIHRHRTRNGTARWSCHSSS